MSKICKKYLFLYTSLILFSCENGKDNRALIQVDSFGVQGLINDNGKAYGQPMQDPRELIKDFTGFWVYYNQQVNLEDDFIGVDSSFKVIDKSVFLRFLCSGDFFPVRLKSDKQVYYQLFKPASWPESDIPSTIKSLAVTALRHHEMEGTILPEFSLLDIRGNRINSDSINGKLLVLKFWFINCIRCIEEFPELNKLVDKYKKTPDIIFLSMALDDNKKLHRFLEKRPFKYKVAGNQKDFIDSLRINEFPTHIIVGKEGKIFKVLSSCVNLEKYIQEIVNI